MSIFITNSRLKYILLILLFIASISMCTTCRTGYVKKNGQWTWTTRDVQFGTRNHWIEGVDSKTFKVIKKNRNYGVDRSYAYFQGRKINNSSSVGFEVLTKSDYGYARDNKFVFFDQEVIIGADPYTFQILEFPYSKDKNDVYCGTLPLQLSETEIEEFKVTNTDQLMKGMKSIMKLSYFIESNPEYQWITTSPLRINHVITGPWGTGETSKYAFKGIERKPLD
jgi:hypothetical protein